MKRVVIGMKNGKPFVMSCPGKIEVVFKTAPRRSIRKLYRTGLYHIRTLLANLH
jgi:hypothetical protein